MKKVETELIQSLKNAATASFETNKSFGRTGKIWAIESEITFQAAQLIERQAQKIKELTENNNPFIIKDGEIWHGRAWLDLKGAKWLLKQYAERPHHYPDGRAEQLREAIAIATLQRKKLNDTKD